MSTVLLRTLTEKSFLKFGKFAEQKVGDMMKRKKFYLIWVYFNCSMITFTDQILDDLFIPQEDRIKKPGCNKGAEAKQFKQRMRYSGFWAKQHMKKVLRLKRNRHDTVIGRQTTFTKGTLQARNHGR